MVRTLIYRVVLPLGISSALLIAFAFSVQANASSNPSHHKRSLERQEHKYEKPRPGPISLYDTFTVLDSTRSFTWESSQWVDSMRHTYIYDVNSNVSNHARQYWEDAQWANSFNFNYVYDENGNLTESIEQNWDSPPPPLEYIFRMRAYTYNPDGSLNDSIRLYLRQDTIWDISSRWAYVYDIDGIEVLYLNQVAEWFDDPPVQYLVWRNEYQALSTYEDGKKTEYLEQTWTGDWVDLRKDTYAYDGSGNLIDSSTFSWEGGQWVELMKITFSYDLEDNQIGRLDQYYEDGLWVNSWNFTYDYDANGNQTGYLEQYWDGSGWENTWKDSSAYDINDNITENIGYYWNWSTEQWDLSNRFTYAYDGVGRPTEYLEQVWDVGQWTNDYRDSYFYSQMTTVETGAGSQVAVDPEEGVSLVFDSVDAAGNTSVTVGVTGPTADVFVIFPEESPEYIYVSTDAEYVGSIELCLIYDVAGMTPEEEGALALFHYHDGAWADITSSKDTASNQICCTTENLSPFALGIAEQPMGVDDDTSLLPLEFTLGQNYPNPFNPSTSIEFSLAQRSNVTITVYNLLGRNVHTLVNTEMSAGSHTVTWDGTDSDGRSVSTGIYFYRIITDNFSSSKKMLLLK